MQHTPPPQTKALQDSYLVSLLVPPDHLLMRLKAAVDFSFVRALVADLYDPSNGRPATDPALLFGLCFLQTLYGLSDREVIADTQVNLAMRAFLGVSVEDKLPHPSLLSVFRRNLGVERFREIFNQSVQMAVAAGLVSQRLLMVDSGGIVADICLPRLRQLLRRVTFKALRVLVELDAGQRELLEEWQTLRDDNSWWQTKELKDKNLAAWWLLAEALRERLEQVRGEEQDQEQRRRAALELLAGVLRRQGARRAGQARDGLVSDVDAEARWSAQGRGKMYVGYREQIAVDADSDIITAVEVTPANVDDSEMLPAVVEAHEKASGAKPQAVTADSKYHSGENRKRLAEQEIEDFVAVPAAKGHKKGEFSASDFQVEYNERGEPWQVTCPQGQRAASPKQKKGRPGWNFYFSRGQCAGCPLRDKCTKQKRGRTVAIGEHFRENAEARERAATEAFQQRQIERLGIERQFAQRRRRSGLGRARYRGVEKVTIQALLASTVGNMLKLPGVAMQTVQQVKRAGAEAACIAMVAESCTG